MTHWGLSGKLARVKIESIVPENLRRIRSLHLARQMVFGELAESEYKRIDFWREMTQKKSSPDENLWQLQVEKAFLRTIYQPKSRGRIRSLIAQTPHQPKRISFPVEEARFSPRFSRLQPRRGFDDGPIRGSGQNMSLLSLRRKSAQQSDTLKGLSSEGTRVGLICDDRRFWPAARPSSLLTCSTPEACCLLRSSCCLVSARSQGTNQANQPS